MGKVMPTEIKEPFERLPGGVLQAKVSGATALDIPTEGGASSIYGVILDLEVTAPVEAVGIHHQERFFLGTKEDPGADLPETLMKRAGRLEKVCQAVGMSCKGADLDIVCSELSDREVLIHVVQELEPAMKKDRQSGAMMPNPYAGRVRSNVRGWFALDSGHELRIDDPIAEPQATPALTKPAPLAAVPGAPRPLATPGAPPKPVAAPQPLPRRLR